MLCEICKINDAIIHVKQIINGVVRELHACEACAEKSGLAVQDQLGLGGFLSAMNDAPAVHRVGPAELTCPECHMRESDFRRTQRLGCPVCYEAFRDELDPMLLAMHKGRSHEGKIPVAEKAITERRALEKQLQAAVAEQRFEDAAVLRDQIRHLEPLPEAATGEGA